MTPLKWAGVILLLPLLTPMALLLGFWYIGRALVLHTLLLIFWVPRDRCVLFVYSNSPNWKDSILLASSTDHLSRFEFFGSGSHCAMPSTGSRSGSSD